MAAGGGNFVLDKGFHVKAGEVITKFRAVKQTATGEVAPVTAVGDLPIGVAQFSVSAAELLKGKGASVRLMGITLMEASEAIAINDLVVLASDGRAATTPVNGDRVVGIAMSVAANAGDQISVFLVGTRLFTSSS